ncbi:MAG: hypothetical protein QMD88_03305 [Coprothermobacterota bacterium]|nr:hypothetical protein [Coprothermobacterota bacterium]
MISIPPRPPPFPYPRSPKLNGKVERVNHTLKEEFWAFYEDEDNPEEMRAALRELL